MADLSPARIALVTGAGSGIGRAAAQGLLAAGWTAVLVGRRREALEETARESGAPAARLLVAPADVTDPIAVRGVFDAIRRQFGRLDLLFNNAGVSAPAMPLEDLPVAKWREVIDTNITGAFVCTQEAFRLMKAQEPRGGRIINNGSISAHVPRPQAAAYNAAKHAVTGLTKSAALDGRPFNIACGQIDIGNVEVGMATRMKTGVLQADGRVAPEPTFPVKHLVDAVVYMAGLPLEANVPFMTVMATGMPYIGRG
jgi:NAD(P)-dependent dehydrogenase (short-subunit alcohol dehydrogenase family)